MSDEIHYDRDVQEREQKERDSRTPHTSPVTPVRIDVRLIHRIGVREWGLPSLCMTGKIWRSKERGTISCMLHKDAKNVRIETLPLVIVDSFETSWMPDHWRSALWEYVNAWPSSGCGLGPFLSITEEQRCDFLRTMANELAKSDNIGCRAIAHDIGQFAAYDYALPEMDKNNPKNHEPTQTKPAPHPSTLTWR